MNKTTQRSNSSVKTIKPLAAIVVAVGVLGIVSWGLYSTYFAPSNAMAKLVTTVSVAKYANTMEPFGVSVITVATDDGRWGGVDTDPLPTTPEETPSETPGFTQGGKPKVTKLVPTGSKAGATRYITVDLASKINDKNYRGTKFKIVSDSRGVFSTDEAYAPTAGVYNIRVWLNEKMTFELPQASGRAVVTVVD